MDSFQKKTITTSRFTFSYYVSEPSVHRPTLLLLHGFPDDARLWNGIASKLGQYHLVVPDLLGYSGTSKPTDPAAYSYRGLTQDLIEILDAEGIKKVISVGHDWGSTVAQRLYAYHPDRVEGLVMLNMGYLLPSPVPLDLDSMNALLEKTFGYPGMAYWEFFTSDDAPSILRAKAGRFYDALHCASVERVMELFCVRGNMRKLLLSENWNVEVRPYAQDADIRRKFVERFERDGFEAPLCYYLATTNNVLYEDENAIPKDDLVVRVPTLQIICTQDVVCRPEVWEPAKQGGFLPDLEEVTIDCGHWSPLESPGETSDAIMSFLEKRFAL